MMEILQGKNDQGRWVQYPVVGYSAKEWEECMEVGRHAVKKATGTKWRHDKLDQILHTAAGYCGEWAMATLIHYPKPEKI